MTTVVISQPMFFPWVGMFEQIRLADVYVHYDDVQFSKGSFTNRVQVKTSDGFRWLTLPLGNRRLESEIRHLTFDDRKDWRRSHLSFLEQTYRGAPFARDMIELVEKVYAARDRSFCDLVIDSMECVLAYFEIAREVRIVRSSELPIPGQSSERVLDVVRHFGGTKYVTGHGAKRYLDHELFERAGVAVEYIQYEKHAYPQLHGAFNPFVSILDLIANVGPTGRDVIRSSSIPWREALAAPDAIAVDPGD